MALPDIMDKIAVHAAAGALAIDAKFKDVAVGHPMPRGRSVRIYYGGESLPPFFGEGRTLTTRMVGQRVLVRGFWPVSEYAAKRGRVLMREMWSFVHELRTRLLGDETLSGSVTALDMNFADADDAVFGGVLFALIDAEIIVDFAEYVEAP